MGVFATRSPHRPCPIGVTVAKMEAVQGNMVLLSGVDLVDGTPILDIKPYLPYCDSIQGAVVPEWVTEDKLLAVASISFSEGFSSSLADCWKTVEKKSLYASPEELQSLIKQVLSWDIRSISQRNQPHDLLSNQGNVVICSSPDSNFTQDNEQASLTGDKGIAPNDDVKYHLILEAFDVSYRIDNNSNVIVEKVEISSDVSRGNLNRSSYSMWRDALETV